MTDDLDLAYAAVPDTAAPLVFVGVRSMLRGPRNRPHLTADAVLVTDDLELAHAAADDVRQDRDAIARIVERRFKGAEMLDGGA